MSNNIILKTVGQVTTNDRTFTRLVGGFGDDKPVITIKQIAELIGYEIKRVNETINNNIQKFENGTHIIDLKNSVDKTDPIYKTLMDIGLSKQSISNSKNIYILSQAGFLLYLKFAEGDKAVELYKNFIEDYFKTKAENQLMHKTIDEQLKELKETKAKLIGLTVMEQDEVKRIQLSRSLEQVNNSIIELEKSITKQAILESVKPKLDYVNAVHDSKDGILVREFCKLLYDGYNFNIGEKTLYKWLRDQKYLMRNHEPYQQYMPYFQRKERVVITKYGTKKTTNTTLITGKGQLYLFKKLQEFFDI